MPNVYTILGESNTRKSSTVRALTGVPQQYDAWTVATQAAPTAINVNIDVYVQIQALQEAQIAPQGFVKKIADVDQHRINHGLCPVNNILIPLRILAVNGFPDGTVYLQHFAQVGWTIHQIVVLGTITLLTPLPAGSPTFNQISNSTQTPVNQIARDIRGWWHWL